MILESLSSRMFRTSLSVLIVIGLMMELIFLGCFAVGLIRGKALIPEGTMIAFLALGTILIGVLLVAVLYLQWELVRARVLELSGRLERFQYLLARVSPVPKELAGGGFGGEREMDVNRVAERLGSLESMLGKHPVGSLLERLEALEARFAVSGHSDPRQSPGRATAIVQAAASEVGVSIPQSKRLPEAQSRGTKGLEVKTYGTPPSSRTAMSESDEAVDLWEGHESTSYCLGTNSNPAMLCLAQHLADGIVTNSQRGMPPGQAEIEALLENLRENRFPEVEIRGIYRDSRTSESTIYTMDRDLLEQAQKYLVLTDQSECAFLFPCPGSGDNFMELANFSCAQEPQRRLRSKITSLQPAQLRQINHGQFDVASPGNISFI